MAEPRRRRGGPTSTFVLVATAMMLGITTTQTQAFATSRTSLSSISSSSLSLRVATDNSVVGIGADARFDNLTGRVLTPGSSGPGWWDGQCAAMPIVLPPHALMQPPSRWRCYYYGRPNDRWNANLPAFLPTGISGVAESDDGLHWTRVRGPLAEGAVLRPSDDSAAFDYVHVGLTDIIPQTDGSYVALYLGGSVDELSLGMGPGPIKGFRMRPGIAVSKDGIAWERLSEANPMLDVGETGSWDSVFCSWPRALPVDVTKPDGEWIMTYHSLMPPDKDGIPRWAVGVAVSTSGSVGPYTKLDGPVLSGGTPGSFDEAGIGTRHVVHNPNGPGLVMVYEGVSGADGRHRLGLATSIDNGRTWNKVMGVGVDPGGPIFEGAPPDDNAWDNGNVGTPWVMQLSDGRWRLYYVGTSRQNRAVAIGAAESDELFSSQWTRVKVTGSGMCIDERNAVGETSLILAAERGDAKDVLMLLDLGADPRATSGTGWTALHGAAECGSVSAIQMLLEAGADVLVVTRAGKTSLDIAQKYNKQDVIEELLKLGAVSGQNVVKS